MLHATRLIIALLAATLLSGCASSWLPYEIVRESYNNRIIRGVVVYVSSKGEHSNVIDKYTDGQLSAFALPDYSRRQLKEEFVLVRVGFDGDDIPVFSRKELALEEGDIVDFYSGVVNEEAWLKKQTRFDEPIIVLGVVCRVADDGCKLNSSKATTEGIGRRMSGLDDYRGVEEESLGEFGIIKLP